MSGQKHPDTEALARFRAGLAGGLRGRRLASHVAHCARCASVSEELDAVSSVLASVPAATLPDAFESRITAALAAESAARQPAVTGAAADREPVRLVSADHRSRPARHARPSRPHSRQLSLRFHPAMAVVPVIALVLIGFGFLLSHAGFSSNSSSSAASGQAAPAVSASASGPVPAAAQPSAAASSRDFVVTISDTHYEAGTLRAQVLSKLASHSARNTPAVPSAISSASTEPSSSSFAASGGNGGDARGTKAASATLVGCALRLTGGVLPSLVDRASYQGQPAYVIAVPDHAWVVGLNCTASDPHLIAQVALNGTP